MKKCIKMYENKYKNLANADLKDLERFLQLMADLDEELELFAIGGTAMVLANIKEATKDIDFLTTSGYKAVKEMFERAGLKEEEGSKNPNIWYLDNKIRIDIFFDEFILNLTLPDDWKGLSEHIRDIGRLKLYILNWYDIIITKIDRSEKRDIEDILSIIEKKDIDLGKLKERYYKLAPGSMISHHDIKFRHLAQRLK